GRYRFRFHDEFSSASMTNDNKTYLSRELSQLLLIDHQPTVADAVQSIDRQLLESNVIALARVAYALGIPITLTVLEDRDVSKPFYRDPEQVLGGHTTVVRTSLNVWDDLQVMGTLARNARPQLVVSGLWTEQPVCSSAISAMQGANYAVFVVTDACGGTTEESHALACRRMSVSGARLVTLKEALVQWQESTMLRAGPV
ncbi:MAG: isochorismatase family protein, partial [Woeseiaceae bacterium]|nr:isochorismatase family protein [Woeseiaceae bacterium]